MFQIGDSLREARTARGFSPADVHKAIRIRERYLTALEEERWDMLPGEAYTKGFLRTYAEFLGLNGSVYVDEYNTRFTHHDEEPPLVPDSLVASHRTRRGVLWLGLRCDVRCKFCYDEHVPAAQKGWLSLEDAIRALDKFRSYYGNEFVDFMGEQRGKDRVPGAEVVVQGRLGDTGVGRDL